MKRKGRRVLRVLGLAALWSLGTLSGASLWAQENPQTGAPAEPVTKANEAAPDPSDEDSVVTMIPHAEWDRLWISGQANFISQYHPGFHSPYRGKNSLSAEAQDATSRVLTLFTGLRVTKTTE